MSPGFTLYCGETGLLHTSSDCFICGARAKVVDLTDSPTHPYSALFVPQRFATYSRTSQASTEGSQRQALVRRPTVPSSRQTHASRRPPFSYKAIVFFCLLQVDVQENRIVKTLEQIGMIAFYILYKYQYILTYNRECQNKDPCTYN
jgi:hypothetical protein